jgi:hypothetical protein
MEGRGVVAVVRRDAENGLDVPRPCYPAPQLKVFLGAACCVGLSDGDGWEVVEGVAPVGYGRYTSGDDGIPILTLALALALTLALTLTLAPTQADANAVERTQARHTPAPNNSFKWTR